jgi:NTP pyrophosphatase (non-canonical NTP hydrolase)
LRRDFQALAAGCHVLSPVTVDFVAEVDGFVLARHELDREPRDVEQGHLEALQQADFVWLHAPDGYVGPSAALELGVAHALGIPVFARSPPADSTLRNFVEVVVGVDDAASRAAAHGTHTPARPLDVLQDYYGRIAARRGYDRESAQDAMLLLTEEVGELARAIRERVGLQRSGGYLHEDAAAELADIQLYLLHLANILDVRLAGAVRDKERANAERHSVALAA